MGRRRRRRRWREGGGQKDEEEDTASLLRRGDNSRPDLSPGPVMLEEFPDDEQVEDGDDDERDEGDHDGVQRIQHERQPSVVGVGRTHAAPPGDVLYLYT